MVVLLLVVEDMKRFVTLTIGRVGVRLHVSIEMAVFCDQLDLRYHQHPTTMPLFSFELMFPNIRK